MSTPWQYIDAEDAIVEDLLAGTLELLAEAGGWLHPGARLTERAGQLSLTCSAADGEPLVRVPVPAFIRVGRIEWSDSRERLETVTLPDDMTDTEFEMLQLQVALHNQAGKLPWLVHTHPVLAEDLPADVIDAVRAFRPSFRRAQPTPASLFWSNRCFRVLLPGQAAPEPVAIPVVDLLNHHRGGAVGHWDGAAFEVGVRRPSGTVECALDYGLRRDAVGMAVVYGFADTSGACAHSAPLRTDVAGIGSVRVAAKGRSRAGRLLPVHVRREDDALVISHLTFEPGGLSDLVGQVAERASIELEPAAAIVQAVARANVALLDELIVRAGRHPEVPAASILEQAGRVQAAIIEPFGR